MGDAQLGADSAFSRCLAVAVTVTGQSSVTGNSFVGAWRVTEIADAKGGRSPIRGQVCTSSRHTYSFARINGAEPLPVYPSNNKATDADKFTVFNALFLNSGTYAVTGNRIGHESNGRQSTFAIEAPKPV